MIFIKLESPLVLLFFKRKNKNKRKKNPKSDFLFRKDKFVNK